MENFVTRLEGGGFRRVLNVLKIWYAIFVKMDRLELVDVYDILISTLFKIQKGFLFFYLLL